MAYEWTEAGDYTYRSLDFSKSMFVVHLWQNIYSRNIELMEKASSCIDFSFFQGQCAIIGPDCQSTGETGAHTHTHAHTCMHVYTV